MRSPASTTGSFVNRTCCILAPARFVASVVAKGRTVAELTAAGPIPWAVSLSKRGARVGRTIVDRRRAQHH